MKEWQQEVKKARRGCLITIYNHTLHVLNLSNSKVHGKWSDGFSSGPIESSSAPQEQSIDSHQLGNYDLFKLL